MNRFLPLLAALALSHAGCKTNDVIIINTPPAVSPAPKPTSTSTTTRVVRPQGKSDPTAIEPVKSPATYTP